MRFTLAALFLIVGTGLAAPLARRSLVSDVGGLLGGITQGVVVDVVALETQLVTLLGPIVQKIEAVLPVTLAAKLVSLVQTVEGQVAATAGINNVVQIVGEALAMVAQGVDLNAVNAYLNAATGGSLTTLEVALGVNNLTEVLGLTQ
ncbi:uncharacterized protein TRIVIDRAFT_225829 [Trichoderma virens Gv29-8]|uniref:Uncharacterized protein n=1 Tax=Hypocrea virens (strain Gv29-8 / FGSC 10586) TaxID=413071 RepID=G9N4J9_HYPVG|nr:uncharacterized protein TRIVIDRAFT_225829 [Trichoderma virens Gv29-8]EHK18524.1 hypothetical protein TRIVIDRAFT_225829 [Trichoderma virens Gv29-8]UKZ52732.1 hypothetical protein TrVGV298_006517 [Trichoderma virens]UKZ78537.1 hypothetical protein TrVFT333_006281 [Trichoderma virens FT-333]